MADEKKAPRKNMHASYVGEFKADSLKVEDGVASATFVTANGDEKVVKGYNDNAKTLQDAVAAGGEQIIRGTLLGGGKNPHMGIYATGPEQLAGVATKVRDNFDTYEAEGKTPYVNMFVQIERGEHKIGRPMVAYGDDALALKGVEEGARVEVPGRLTRENRAKDGEEAKWTEVYRVTGKGSFEPAAEKAPEADM